MKKLIACFLAAAMLLGLAACGETKKESVDLNALYDSFQETLPEMFLLDEDNMMNLLGIDTADCVQVIVAVSNDGLRADEVWLIEATDAKALERIQSLAQTRLVAKEDETVVYSPEQYKVVCDAELVTEGMYLALLVSPDVETLKTTFADAVK